MTKKGFCLCWTPILTKLHSVGWSIVAIALLGIPWASTITVSDILYKNI